MEDDMLNWNDVEEYGSYWEYYDGGDNDES